MAEILKQYGYRWNLCPHYEMEAYVEKVKLDLDRSVFLHPSIQEFVKTEASGKKVLDIGCGLGHWCCEAAKYGAKSVDGFDIQEGMVELAKQATAQYSSVSICVGDVMDMPYDDNTFDVAISILVTCNLPTEALTKHFEELSRVLVPGGKALVHNLSNAAFQTLYLFSEDNESSMRKSIEQVLRNDVNLSPQPELSDAFEGFRVVRACFTKDENGMLFLVNNTNQLINGQRVWFKNENMIFPNHYYSNKYLATQILEAGLGIKKVENPYTEDKRVVHNYGNSRKRLSKTITENPPSFIYYVYA